MKTITVNERELALLRRAVEVLNDMENDNLLCDTSINLFPTSGEVTRLDHEDGKKLRQELTENFEQMFAIRSLMEKVGSKVNDQGYSV